MIFFHPRRLLKYKPSAKVPRGVGSGLRERADVVAGEREGQIVASGAGEVRPCGERTLGLRKHERYFVYSSYE